MSDNETLNRDKLLLELMTHVYEEDERRNELVDSKNSQMIILSGAMLTLQSTLITKLLIDDVLLNTDLAVALCCKLILSELMLVSIIGYFISMYLFIDAYTFKDDYQMIPHHESVIEARDDNDSEAIIVSKTLDEYNKAIKKNDELIENKINKGRQGFCLLKISGFLTLIFLILFIIILFC
nr:MAG TPA: hypothetical protein [Caudoviricetes sp.]